MTSIVLTPGTYHAEAVRRTRSVMVRGEPGAVPAANIHMMSGHAMFVDLRWSGRLVLGAGTTAAILGTTLTGGRPAGALRHPDARAAREPVDDAEAGEAQGEPSGIWLGHKAHLTARSCPLEALHGAVLQLTGQAQAEVFDSRFLVGAASGPVVRAEDASIVNLSRARPPVPGAGAVVPPAVDGRRRPADGTRVYVFERAAGSVCPEPVESPSLNAWPAVAPGSCRMPRGSRWAIRRSWRWPAGASRWRGAPRRGRLITQDTGVLDASHIRLGGFDDPIVGGGGQLRVTDGYVAGGGAAVRLLSGSDTQAVLERCLFADSRGPTIQVEDSTVCTLADSTVRGSHGVGVAILAGAEAALVACVLEDNVGPAVDAAPGSRGLVTRSVARGTAAETAFAIHRGSSVVLEPTVVSEPTLSAANVPGARAVCPSCPGR